MGELLRGGGVTEGRGSPSPKYRVWQGGWGGLDGGVAGGGGGG